MPTFIIKDKDGDESGEESATTAKAAIKKLAESGDLAEDYQPYEAFELVSRGKFNVKLSQVARVTEVS